MGEPPIRKEELKNVELKNDIRNGDLIEVDAPDDGIQDDFENLSEEEIMRKVMEESLKSA